jgi:hypothetical protein
MFINSDYLFDRRCGGGVLGWSGEGLSLPRGVAAYLEKVKWNALVLESLSELPS